MTVFLIGLMLLGSLPYEAMVPDDTYGFIQDEESRVAREGEDGDDDESSDEHNSVYTAPPVVIHGREATDRVFIMEVYYDPSGNDAGHERIAILNNGSGDVDLGGWYISDSDAEADIALPAWVLPENSVLYIHTGQGSNDDDFDDYEGHFYAGYSVEIFNNDHDSVALYCGQPSKDTLVDFVMWGQPDGSEVAYQYAVQSGLWPENGYVSTTGAGDGIGLGRKEIVPGSHVPSQWEYGRVVINEVLYNQKDSNSGEFIEISNPSSAVVDISGWTVSSSTGFEYQPEDVLLESGQVLLITIAGDESSTDFNDATGIYSVKIPFEDALGDSSGYVLLSDRDSNPVDFVAWGSPPSGGGAQAAIDAGIWTAGDYVSTTVEPGDSIGRDQFSRDTDTSSDWSSGGGVFSNSPTPGIDNRYTVLIWDAALDVNAGDEWIIISNFGGDVNLGGWSIYNIDGHLTFTFPSDFVLPAHATLKIFYSYGEDELNFSDGYGELYVYDSPSEVPSEKVFHSDRDIIIITTGELSDDTVVVFDVWLDGELSRGIGSWFSKAWNTVKSSARWLGTKIASGIRTVGKWAWKKIASVKEWFLDKINNNLLSYNFNLGKYIQVSLEAGIKGWKFQAEASAEVDIPIPAVPGMNLHLSAKGTITIEKHGCRGITMSGEIEIIAGLNYGTNESKIIVLEVRAYLKVVISAGDLDVDDNCNRNTHKGSVTIGIRITLSVVVGGTMKALGRTIIDKDWEWELAKWEWTSSREYTCCRDPKPVVGVPEPEKKYDPPPGESPPYTTPTETDVYVDWHVVNTDDTAHEYRVGAEPLTPGWESNTYPPSGSGTFTLNPGEAAPVYTTLIGPPPCEIPHTFSPVIEPPVVDMWFRGTQREDYIPANEIIGTPGSVITFYLNVTNNVDSIFRPEVLCWVKPVDNESLNSSIIISGSAEPVNIDITTDSSWYVRIFAGDGHEIYDYGSGYQMPNFNGTQRLRIMVYIPPDVPVGHVENMTVAIGSGLPNSTSEHQDKVYLRIRVVSLHYREIWSEDFENFNATDWVLERDWQVGQRTYSFGNSPLSDLPGDTIVATNLSGTVNTSGSYILATPHLNLSMYTHVMLSFRYWLYGGDRFEVIVNSSGNYYQLNDFGFGGPHSVGSTYMSTWSTEMIDLSEYLSESVQIIFCYSSHSNNDVYGWHLDDISLLSYTIGDVLWTQAMENTTQVMENWTANFTLWGIGEPDYSTTVGPSFYPSPAFCTNLSGEVPANVNLTLSSPVISITDDSQCSLYFWHWLYGNGTARVYINSSGIWHLIDEFQGGIYMEDWYYFMADISEFVPGDIQIVFVYMADNTSLDKNYGWHIAMPSIMTGYMPDPAVASLTLQMADAIVETGIYNVSVGVNNSGDLGLNFLTVAVESVYEEPSVVYSEDFNTFTDWTSVDISGYGRWLQINDSALAFEGAGAMGIGDDFGILPYEEDELISPVINISTSTDPMLDFWIYTSLDDLLDGCYLYLSMNGGANWTPIPVWSIHGDAEEGWHHVVLNLSLYIAEEFRMKFVFRSDGENNNGRIIIDRVRILATSPVSEMRYASIYIGPGGEENVSFALNFSDPGRYTVHASVSSTVDSNRGNNTATWSGVFLPHLYMTDISVDTAGEGYTFRISSLRPWYVQGVRFYYSLDGVQWTFIGSDTCPDLGLWWSAYLPINGLDAGTYHIRAEIEDVYGGIRTVDGVFEVLRPQGTAIADFQFSEDPEGSGIFSFTDTTVLQPEGNSTILVLWRYWDFGDGSGTTIKNPVHRYRSDGIYNVTLTIGLNTGGVYSVSRQVEVEILASGQVVPNFTYTPENPTDMDTISFQDTSILRVNITELTWTWDFGDNSTATGRNVEHSYSDNGLYTVTMTITSSLGSWSISRPVMVRNIPPEVDFTYTTDGLTVHFNPTIQDPDGTIASVSWDFGDGSRSEEYSPIHVYASPGQYNVNLTAVDNDGYRSWKTMAITVSTVSYTISGSITYSDGNPDGVSARIEILKDNITVATTVETQGHYTLSLPPGDYTLRASAMNYHPYEDNITLDGDMEIDINLMRIVETTVEIGGRKSISVSSEDGGIVVSVTISGTGEFNLRILDEPPEGSTEPEDAVPMGIYFEATADSMDWIYIEVKYSDSMIPEGRDERDLRMYYWNDTAGEWTPVENSGAYPSENIVWANVTHLTVFSAMVKLSGDEGTGQSTGGNEESTRPAETSGGLSMGMFIALAVLIALVSILGLFFIIRSGRERQPEKEEMEPLAVEETAEEETMEEEGEESTGEEIESIEEEIEGEASEEDTESVGEEGEDMPEDEMEEEFTDEIDGEGGEIEDMEDEIEEDDLEEELDEEPHEDDNGDGQGVIEDD